MTEIPDVWLSVFGAIAVLGIGLWRNRSKIDQLNNAVFGHERIDNGGHESDIESLFEKIDRIESKIDEERENRIKDHHDVESEIIATRFLVQRSIGDLVQNINDEADDLNVEEPDIAPPDGIDSKYYDSSDD